ncbi:hypothetical protein GDO81_024118 [Engystomops pustulosus]|uniref:Uncharacterized protein n=1 Tax=Engystomops pustulosus TaxID=76066 RepID=A0AAV6YKG0_ENGPU|nr:hypothetical protein GDO81_024118 [Engystomops pustulosus]
MFLIPNLKSTFQKGQQPPSSPDKHGFTFFSPKQGSHHSHQVVTMCVCMQIEAKKKNLLKVFFMEKSLERSHDRRQYEVATVATRGVKWYYILLII